MPELPEVQTVVDDLNRKIKGAKILDFWTDWKKSIKLPVSSFRKKIVGAKVVRVARRAKNILIFLDNQQVILVHLKMTGHLLVKPQKPSARLQKCFSEKVNQYIHHVWKLRKNKKKIDLEFSDLRKFAKIKLIDEDKVEQDPDLKNLGAEPLSKSFSFARFEEILKKNKNKNIRIFLLDQNQVAGLGNIYVSEILFDAKISPKRKVAGLKKDEKRKLYLATGKILKKALKLRGTSESDYRDTDGAPGGFQEVMRVYQKHGKACPRKNCAGVIKREKIGQRSAFWCPVCQR